MALTYSTTVDNARFADQMQKGLKVRFAEVTIGATSDYSSGLSVAASKLGFGKIYSVVDANIRASSGTLTDRFHHWDQDTGKLRFFDLSTTAEVVASDLAAGDIVTLLAVGV